MSLTASRLRELLSYDPATGVFTRLVRAGHSNAGDVAGSVDSDGYRQIGIDGKSYKVARLAFLYMTGALPSKRVYYKNGNPLDNRWVNLREAATRQGLTVERLTELLRYNPETGVFTRQVNGEIAGCVNVIHGYQMVGLDGREYRAHRLVWLWQTGAWPKETIDHINGNRADNRWCNLREATKSQNATNSGKHRDNTSGYKGVHLHKPTGKWKAEIMKNGKQKHLGLYPSAELAHIVYMCHAVIEHGEFARFE
jgi:hypothetical protein